MEYDIAALELVKMCASARLSETERAVLTLLLLLEGGKRIFPPTNRICVETCV